jgi:hypothetical protein
MYISVVMASYKQHSDILQDETEFPLYFTYVCSVCYFAILAECGEDAETNGEGKNLTAENKRGGKLTQPLSLFL